MKTSEIISRLKSQPTLADYKKREDKLLQTIFGDLPNQVTSEYSSNDAFIKTLDRTIIAEVKTRNCKSDTYPTELLEQKKYDALISKSENQNNPFVFYICKFIDGVVLVYNLLNISNMNKEVRECNTTTAVDTSRYGQRKDKELIMLDKSTAIRLAI